MTSLRNHQPIAMPAPHDHRRPVHAEVSPPLRRRPRAFRMPRRRGFDAAARGAGPSGRWGLAPRAHTKSRIPSMRDGFAHEKFARDTLLVETANRRDLMPSARTKPIFRPFCKRMVPGQLFRRHFFEGDGERSRAPLAFLTRSGAIPLANLFLRASQRRLFGRCHRCRERQSRQKALSCPLVAYFCFSSPLPRL